MSLSQEQAIFLLDACKLIQFATQQGFVVTGGELARTPEQQAIYFKTGRSKTMDSIHLKRCAIDLNFFKDGKIIWDKQILAPIGAFWESLDKKTVGAATSKVLWIAHTLSATSTKQSVHTF
jgi:peptidoglycan L-alanyl-D-glutamate endopeptidase CwlK